MLASLFYTNATGIEQHKTPRVITPSSEGLGASVAITYQVANKCSWDWKYSYIDYDDSSGNIDYVPRMSYMEESDNDVYTIHHASENNPDKFTAYIEFMIDSPYTNLTACHYDIKYAANGGTLESDHLDLYIFSKDGDVNAEFAAVDTEYKGTLTLDSSYVVDGKIHGRLFWDCNDNENAVDVLFIYLDQIAFEYGAVSEVRRSTYRVNGGLVRHDVTYDTWDYRVNTTLTVPADWTYQDINPDCEVTSNEFECLVPKTYTAIYTETVLASANWAERWKTSFESEGNEYIDVMDGYAAYDLTTNKNFSESWSGECWVVWNTYGQTTFQWKAGYTSTIGTAGQWTTTLTYCENIDYLYFNATSATIDCINVYNSSISLGSTLTGTANHIYANGYYFAAYIEVTLCLYNSTYSGLETQTVTTNSGGEWSFNTANFDTTLTTQTYHIWSWIYDNKNLEWNQDEKTEAVTDWEGKPSSSGSATYELDVLNDSMVQSGNPNTNYGGSGTIGVESGMLGFFKFNLTDYSGITDAKFTIYYYDVNVGGTDTLYECSNTTWKELAITWNDKPNTGDSINGITVDSQFRYYSWEGAALDTYIAANAGGLVTLILSSDAGNDHDLRAKEYATAANRPHLNITAAVTAPATITADTDSKEGTYSIEYEFNEASNWVEYDPSATLDVNNSLLTYWIKINGSLETNPTDTLITQVYSGVNKCNDTRLRSCFGYTANSWTHYFLPLFSDYWENWNSGLDLTAISAVGWNITDDDSGSWSLKIDGLGFIEYYTKNSISYPFSYPSDWVLIGNLNLGDIYGWWAVESNYECNYTIYENDVSKATGTCAKGGDNLRWTLQTGIDTYYVGVKFVYASTSGAKWLNTSYTVSSKQTTLWMMFRSANGTRIDWEQIDVYVDGEICPQEYLGVNSSDTVNVTVVDMWDVTIYQNTTFTTSSESNTHLDETLDVYNLILVSQKTYGVYAKVTANGITQRYDLTKAKPFLSHPLYANTYTLEWFQTDNGLQLGDTETFTITATSGDYIAYTPREPPPDDGGGYADLDENDNGIVDSEEPVYFAIQNLGTLLIALMFIVPITGLAVIFFRSFTSGQIVERRP
jgi:hypothetical protein